MKTYLNAPPIPENDKELVAFLNSIEPIQDRIDCQRIYYIGISHLGYMYRLIECHHWKDLEKIEQYLQQSYYRDNVNCPEKLDRLYHTDDKHFWYAQVE